MDDSNPFSEIPLPTPTVFTITNIHAIKSPSTTTSSTTTTTKSKTSFPPLTTPWTRPSYCTDLFTTTSTITTVGGTQNPITSTIPLVLPDTAHPSFSLCHAPGYDLHNYSFSPGVCPSGWTAYNLASSWTTATYTSFAHCCDKGYTFGYGNPISGSTSVPACFRSAKGTSKKAKATATPGARTYAFEEYLPNGVQMHEAYHVLWESRDVSMLEPSPPKTLCEGRAMEKWVPGEKVPKCPYDGAMQGWESVFWFLAVGLPLIIVFSCVGCCACCRWRNRRLKRKVDKENKIREESRNVVAV
ncbi:hypothetical protein QBC38DRAFT_462306 [Podospora fimiseda]|uniref:Uncharacterized protein n=1 Tax=Podospora fimiseda TaxID=252190 RepID=A0AAN7BCH7_9PEZI|nr:hypothetical protein QBC38DRAFT_462306 [Podospora fimiseda]